MFCGKCGKQAGTAPPPKPRKFCQGCGMELPEGMKFCQGCGHQAPGMGFSMPSGGSINIQAASGFIGDVTNKLGITLQRLAIAVTCLLGFIACLLPWYSVSAMGATASANAFSITRGGFGMNASIFNFFGFLSVIGFVVMLILCFIGNRGGPLGKLRIGCIVCAILCLLGVGICLVIFGSGDYKTLSSVAGGGIGFGLILALLMSLALGAIPFIKKLEG